MIDQEVIELNTQKWLADRATERTRKQAEQDAKDAAAYAVWKLANGIEPGPMSREQYVQVFDPCALGGL